MPGGSVGACTSTNKGAEELPERESESSYSSDSESDSDQENSTPMMKLFKNTYVAIHADCLWLIH